MEYLPPNLILKILEYVPIQNRLKLRTISKQFKELIDFKIPEQLILYFDNSPICKKYLNDNNLLIIKEVEFYSTANLLKFKKIKKLKLNLSNQYLISADYFLNLFEELIELYILDYNFYDFNLNLQLKKLKKLKSDLYLRNQNRLKLDTPSLIELKIEELRNVNIIYPDKLLILKIDSFDFDLTELFKFKNLEQLKIKNDSDSLTILNRELFERLINLNKLIIIDIDLKQISDWDSEEENKLNEINNFNYKRENLEITINGVEIDQLKGLNSDNFFNFWIKSVLNSSKVNKIKLDKIYYNEFMNLFNYELPTNFHIKITKISIIIIDGKIEDESKLINLIKRSNANSVYFYTKLSKSFYRKLNIENFSFNNVHFFNKSNLNFFDKETNDFMFNSKIQNLQIHTKSLSSGFKHSIDYLSNYNLENYSNRSIQFKDRYDASINFHIYDNYVSIQIYDYRHSLPIDQSELKLNKIEFLKILNLIRKSLVDVKYDLLKLKFLIDRYNSINSSYSIMIKKLFRTYYISKQIFKSNSI